MTLSFALQYSPPTDFLASIGVAGFYPRIMVNYTPSSDEVELYEFCILYAFPLSQKEEQDILKEIEGIFGEAGGKQVAKDLWGRRGLAFTIEGYKEGNYAIYHYELEPSKLKEVDNAFRISKGILRYMITKPPKGYVIESYSAKYEEWLKSLKDEEKEAEHKKEAELTRKVVERAKMKAKKVEEEKKDDEKVEKPAVAKKELSAELEKLISDDDLDI